MGKKSDSELKEGKPTTIYVPKGVQDELEEIKKKYKVKNDRDALIIWKALQITGQDDLVLDKQKKKDEESDKVSKKKSKDDDDPITGVIKTKMAEVVDHALEPAVHTVKKTAEKLTKEDDDDDERRRPPSPPMLPMNPSIIQKQIEEKIEEAKRKLREEEEQKEIKKTLQELKQELDWYVNQGYLSRLQEMKQIEELLNELGYTKEDKSMLIEVLQQNVPDIIELIDGISKRVLDNSIDERYYMKVERMLKMLEGRAEKLERLYAEKKIDQKTYMMLITEIERAIMELTRQALLLEGTLANAMKSGSGSTESSDEDEDLEDIDNLFK